MLLASSLMWNEPLRHQAVLHYGFGKGGLGSLCWLDHGHSIRAHD